MLLVAVVLAIMVTTTDGWPLGEIGAFALALVGAVSITLGCMKLRTAASR